MQNIGCCRHHVPYVLQVLQWVMSYDNENPTEALAITAASAALAVSGELTLHRACDNETQ